MSKMKLYMVFAMNMSMNFGTQRSSSNEFPTHKMLPAHNCHTQAY